MDNIAIVGVAQTKYERKKKDKTYYDLVYEMTREAMDDAGLTLEDIDNVITVSNDFLDGRTISSMAVGDAAGAHDKNVSTVEGDGTFGAFYGAMRVLGGFRSTLVVVHAKGSEGDVRTVTNGMFDPIFQRLLGLEAVSSSALQASMYMDRYGLTEEDFAKVSVKNHGNAKNNPLAHLPLDLTVDDVMGSEKLADPIKRLDCSPVSDGAAAIIIADERHAQTARTRPVWIKGIAHCSDEYFLGDRDLAEPKALRDAAKRAYAMAGITDPMKSLDVVDLYDAFAQLLPLQPARLVRERRHRHPCASVRERHAPARRARPHLQAPRLEGERQLPGQCEIRPHAARSADGRASNRAPAGRAWRR